MKKIYLRAFGVVAGSAFGALAFSDDFYIFGTLCSFVAGFCLVPFMHAASDMEALKK